MSVGVVLLVLGNPAAGYPATLLGDSLIYMLQFRGVKISCAALVVAVGLLVGLCVFGNWVDLSKH
jgi:hypothetical protein